MQIKIITLKYDPVIGRIDDSNLTDFIKDKEVMSVKDYFFIKDECPNLIMVVTYRQIFVAEAVPGKSPPLRERDKWRELIGDEDLPLFNTIRGWRIERAKRDGVPPYVICTNIEIAHMVKKRPQSLNKLSEIEGFGRGKVEKYGQELLNLLSQQKGENEKPE